MRMAAGRPGMPRTGALLIGLFAMASAACTSGIQTIPADPSPPHAEQRDGAFRLTFDLPKRSWRTDEAIQGMATLSLVDAVPQEFGRSSGGVFSFEFAATDGAHDIGPISSADCVADRLVAGVPMTSAITKSGATSAEQPDAGFIAAFLSDPVVHLPPGDWEIDALATFVGGRDCSGAAHELRAQVVIHVTP